MLSPYRQAPDSVVATVEHMINLYHEDLQDARIGVLMRDEAPVSDGRATLGKAQKVTDQWRPYANYDFVIWFAEDWWYKLSQKQQMALADHELQHCEFLGGKASMRKHDIEEFACIIERHGFWWPQAKSTVEILQQASFGLTKGNVSSVPAAVADMMALREQWREDRGVDIQLGGVYVDALTQDTTEPEPEPEPEPTDKPADKPADDDHDATGISIDDVLGEDGAE